MKKFITFILICLTILCFASCDEEIEAAVYQAEGGTNAFKKSVYDGGVVTISSGSITYGTKDLSSKYRTAMATAVKKVSDISSNVSITTDTTSNTGNFYAGSYTSAKSWLEVKDENGNDIVSKTFMKESDFVKIEKIRKGRGYETKITVDEKLKARLLDISGANALNANTYDSSNCITKSYIFFNTTLMDNYKDTAKAMLAMHELGHTLGLVDFYSGSTVYDNDATIMKYDYGKGMTIFKDYTKFDKQCIKDIYGE